MQNHWKNIERTCSDDITTWDEEQKEIFRQHQVDKINACARKLFELEYFTGEQLANTLREYGVGRGYLERMYQLEWCYVWELSGSYTWREFIFNFICKVNMDSVFRDVERLDDIHKVDKYCEKYRYNERTHMVDYYEQQYRWKIACKKRSGI